MLYKKLPLEQLPHKSGDWEHSGRYLEIDAAQKWGLVPSKFYALDITDRAYMIAKIKVDAMIQSWDAQVSEEESKKASRRASASNFGRKFRTR